MRFTPLATKLYSTAQKIYQKNLLRQADVNIIVALANYIA